MKVQRGFDEKRVCDIARDCGSQSVKSSIAYLRRAHYNSPDKFVCEIIDDVAFWAGGICKRHLRLYELAVRNEAQGKGYGKAIMLRILAECRQKGLRKITLRTAKNESAVNFYRRFGGRIAAEKGDDWEMEINL